MRIYMVRHGESVDDIEDCYGGIADFPLTERGREQASAVGRQLRDQGIQAIYSSPLSRAHEAATIIVAELGTGLDLTVVDELQERNSYGVLSGVNKARAALIFQKVLAQLSEKPGSLTETPTGAEESDVFFRRVERAFDSVVADASSRDLERIAVITHGKFTQALFQHVLGIDGNIYLTLGSVNQIDYEPPHAKLVQQPAP